MIQDLFFKIMGRYNPNEENGAIQFDMAYPVYNKNISWHFQYWNGYGESLIDYNETYTKLGLGLMFTR